MVGTPDVMNGAVLGITQVGRKIIAVGTFTSVSPAGTFGDKSDDLSRRRIFAFDSVTGEIDRAFHPVLSGPAYTVDSNGRTIYVGGSFTAVNGSGRYRRLVQLTTAGRIVAGFRAMPNDQVNEVVVRGSRVFVGGHFSRITTPRGAITRHSLAAVQARTGAVLGSVNVPFTGVYNSRKANSGGTNIKGLDVSPSGARLVAVGNFSMVGGKPRSQVAVLSTTGRKARVTPWSTTRFDPPRNHCARKFDVFVRDVEFSTDGSWFVVSSSGGFGGGAATGTLCDSVSRWSTTDGRRGPAWVDYTGGDSTSGIEVTRSAVYVGGHMRWMNNPLARGRAGGGAVPREGIAALDPVNGLPLSWNPGRSRGVGAQALFATAQGLWVGSDTNLINGKRRAKIALMPAAGGTQVPYVPAASLPNDLFVAPLTNGVLRRRAVNGAGVPVGSASSVNNALDWSRVRGAFQINHRLYYGHANGNLYWRTFNPDTGETGPQNLVNLYPDAHHRRIPFPISRVTGMFYDPGTHRLYYTVVGDKRLLYRYFTPESQVVGVSAFVAQNTSVDFRTVAGMTLARGKIYFGSRDSALRSVRFAGGRVIGKATVVKTGRTWRYRAIFVPNG
jgi:hypothetical protein